MRLRALPCRHTDTTYQNEREREIYIIYLYIERETERQRKNCTAKLTPNLVIKPPRVINYVGAFCAKLFNRKFVLRGDSRQSGNEAIRSYLEQSWQYTKATVRASPDNNSMWSSGDIWNHLQPSGDIWAIWGKLEARGAIWNHPKLSGAIPVAH